MKKQAHLKTILCLLGLAIFIYLVLEYPNMFLAVSIPIGFVALYFGLYNIFKL